MTEERDYYWGCDPYWTTALEAYVRERDQGTRYFDIDIQLLDELVFSDNVAFKLADAMASVFEHEGMDGHRGAPRLVLALMAKLAELGVAKSRPR